MPETHGPVGLGGPVEITPEAVEHLRTIFGREFFAGRPEGICPWIEAETACDDECGDFSGCRIDRVPPGG